MKQAAREGPRPSRGRRVDGRKGELLSGLPEKLSAHERLENLRNVMAFQDFSFCAQTRCPRKKKSEGEDKTGADEKRECSTKSL